MGVVEGMECWAVVIVGSSAQLGVQVTPGSKVQHVAVGGPRAEMTLGR